MLESEITESILSQTQSDTEFRVDESLDARGLNCPLPILKTKVLLNKMNPGDIVYVQSTDPHSVIDFEAYCARTDHELLKINEVDGIFEFYIKRAQNPRNY